jgi:hypothetical protein
VRRISSLVLFGCVGLTVTLLGSAPSAARLDDAQSLGRVVVKKTGDGKVTSEDSPAIRCGAKCEAELPVGSKLVLIATSGQPRLERWEGACVGSATRCEVVVGTRTTVRATFVSGGQPPPANPLRVTIGGNGTVRSELPGLIDCPQAVCQTILSRGVVTLRATPEANWIFVRWSGAKGACRGTDTCSVDLREPADLAATFRRAVVADGRSMLTVRRSGASPASVGFGAFVCPKVCSAEFANRSLVEIQARGGDRFSSWKTGSCRGRAPICVVAISGPESVTAGYDDALPPTIANTRPAVNVTRSGKGRIRSSPPGILCGTGRDCSAAYTPNQRVTLIAEPAFPYTMDRWRGGEHCKRLKLTCTVHAAVGVAVSVLFVARDRRLSVTKSGDGKGRVTSRPGGITCGKKCVARFARGSSVELRAAPDGVSRFAGWSGTCAGIDVCTVRLNGPTSVGARFTRIRDELRVVKTGAGSGLVQSSPAGITCGKRCSAGFPRGVRLLLRATTSPGSRFAGWSGACRGIGKCAFMLRRDSRVEARFARICAAVSASKFSAKVAKRPRRILVTIRLKGKASARLRLFRKGRKIAGKTVAPLGKGLRTLRLNVPRTAAKGRYRIVLRLSDSCGRTRTFAKNVIVPRR